MASKSMVTSQTIDAPIPGANYTSDTRNYPWHRPPEYTDLDSAIDYMVRVFDDREAVNAVVTMMDIGLDITTVCSTVIMKGVERGKWSVDLGILLAGPLSHMLVLFAKVYEIDYDLGIETGRKTPTKAFFNESKKVFQKDKAVKVLEENTAEIKSNASAGGFMDGMGEMTDVG